MRWMTYTQELIDLATECEVGTLITEFIPGEHLEPAPFASRLDDVIDLVRRFHDGGAIAGQFPIHRVVEHNRRADFNIRFTQNG